MNKLMQLQEFHILDFMIDDSGSMQNGMYIHATHSYVDTDSRLPNGYPMTRWQEAILRMKSMIEILAYVPTNTIRIKFLNRREQIVFTRQGQSPQEFIQGMCFPH